MGNDGDIFKSILAEKGEGGLLARKYVAITEAYGVKQSNRELNMAANLAKLREAGVLLTLSGVAPNISKLSAEDIENRAFEIEKRRLGALGLIESINSALMDKDAARAQRGTTGSRERFTRSLLEQSAKNTERGKLGYFLMGITEFEKNYNTYGREGRFDTKEPSGRVVGRALVAEADFYETRDMQIALEKLSGHGKFTQAARETFNTLYKDVIENHRESRQYMKLAQRDVIREMGKEPLLEGNLHLPGLLLTPEFSESLSNVWLTTEQTERMKRYAEVGSGSHAKEYIMNLLEGSRLSVFDPLERTSPQLAKSLEAPTAHGSLDNVSKPRESEAPGRAR